MTEAVQTLRRGRVWAKHPPVKVGNRLHTWTVEDEAPFRVNAAGSRWRRWWLRCEICAARRMVADSEFKRGSVAICSCQDPCSIPAGSRFKDWTVLHEAERHVCPGGSSSRAWHCRCVCGVERVVLGPALRSGHSTGCGCSARKELREGMTQHGHAAEVSPEYRAWTNMLARCRNPKHPSYPDYGGRGIRVCDGWVQDFSAFLGCLGRRPSSAHSLDRIENDGDYRPGNVRWATKAEQSRNRRNNRFITHAGERKTVADWAAAVGMEWKLLGSRLDRGWSMEAALTVPPSFGNKWLGHGNKV